MRLRLFGISIVVALVLGGVARMSVAAGNSFAVSNSGMTAYVIDTVNNPNLPLTRGQTYTFNLSAQGHPFWITTARGAAEASANAFSTGVTNNGFAVGTVTFTVPASAPATLFYQCSFHDQMGGMLNISSATSVPALGPMALAALIVALLVTGVFVARRRARRA